MEELLERLLEECRPFTGLGRVANYIPELAKGNPEALGIYVIGSEGKHSWAGDCFTIQSIIKPILLLQALLDNGVELVQSLSLIHISEPTRPSTPTSMPSSA